MALDTSIYGEYITAGLNKAKGLLDQPAATYTPYTSTAANAPVKTEMYDYTASAPMQRISAPSYKGLMDGDYDKLQSSLAQPGQTAATNAYNRGTQQLANNMSGRGLYGSSIMQQQQTQGLDREYMNAMATNAAQAAAQRYNMQQQGLFNQNAWNQAETQGQRAQEAAFAQNSLQNADMLNQFNNLKYNADKQYNEQMNNWSNQQNYEQNFLYPQAKTAFDQAQTEAIINRALALAGQGAPLSTAATNSLLKEQEIAAMKDAAAQNSSAQLWGAGLSALGTVGGGLLNNAANGSTTTSLFSNLFK